MEVTLKYGLTKQITIEISSNTTLGDILRNPNNKAVLGYPESVTGVVDGVTLGQNDYPADGDVIVLEKQAAAKAA
jgi:hypothetical protein